MSLLYSQVAKAERSKASSPTPPSPKRPSSPIGLIKMNVYCRFPRREKRNDIFIKLQIMETLSIVDLLVLVFDKLTYKEVIKISQIEFQTIHYLPDNKKQAKILNISFNPTSPQNTTANMWVNIRNTYITMKRLEASCCL